MNKKMKIVFSIIAVITVITFTVLAIFLKNSTILGEFINSNIMNIYIFTAVILAFVLIYVLLTYTSILKNKKVLSIIMLVILLGVNSTVVYGVRYIGKVEDSLNNLASNKSKFVLSVKFIALPDSDTASSKELDGKVLGVITDASSKDGNIIPKEFSEKKAKFSEVKEYDSWEELALAYQNGEVNVMPLPKDVNQIFVNDIATTELLKGSTVVATYKKTFEKEVSNTEVNLTEPFTILIVGLGDIYRDEENGPIAFEEGALADVIVLATVNPKEGTMFLASIPRDTLVNPSCYVGYDKVNHTSGQGIECLQSTLEQNFNITINYHMITDFKSVVDIVDYLGGIEIDNPYGEFVEQNSGRAANAVTVPAGKNVLNGEQVLAFSRNRYNGDVDANVRSTNHGIVLEALYKKLKEVNIATKLDTFLPLIEKSLITNFPINDVENLTKLFQELNGKQLVVRRYTVEGVGTDYYSPLSSVGPLYGYIPYQESMNYISNYINMLTNNDYVIPDNSFNFSSSQ